MYPKYCVHVIEVIALFLCSLFYYISVNFIRQTDYVTSTINLICCLVMNQQGYRERNKMLIMNIMCYI